MGVERANYFQNAYNNDYQKYLNTGMYSQSAIASSLEQQPPQQEQQQQPVEGPPAFTPPPAYNPPGMDFRENNQKLIAFYKKLQPLFEPKNAAPLSNVEPQTSKDGNNREVWSMFANLLELAVRLMSANQQQQTPPTHVSGIANKVTIINNNHSNNHNISNSSPAMRTNSNIRPLTKQEQEEIEKEESKRKEKEEQKTNTVGAAALAIGIAGSASYLFGYAGKMMLPDDTQVGEIAEFMTESEKSDILPKAPRLTLMQTMDKWAVTVMLASGTALAVVKVAPGIFNKPVVPFITLMTAVIFKGMYQGAKDKEPADLTRFGGPRIRNALVQKLEYFENKRNSALVTMTALAAMIGSATVAASSYFIPQMKRHHAVSWKGVKVLAAFIAVKWVAEKTYNTFVRDPAMVKLDREMSRSIDAELEYLRSF